MDFELPHLELAFAYHVIQQVVGADGVVGDAELRFVEERFPPAVLRSAGFKDARGRFTDRYEEALGDALLELPVRLPMDARLVLIDLFLDASLADDDHGAAEAVHAARAARLLGIPDDVLAAHVASRGDDLPVPSWTKPATDG
ncbi:MAG: hypothetical protein H6733_13210 [Alphaproteobacteria bacterium]|nr:hypothetical protein [Alphaproteobacteria bacterium]